MIPFATQVVPIQLVDEMRSSYLDYSMSVIIGRALPDVRDGLKPVHRRILYAMYREGLLSSKKHSKCAGVVGEVLKKYHPHGDSAVYDALVRMAQPWNLRYLLVDGQGNFGSVDGDPAAAYRYTECRLTALAEEMLTDIDRETVDFTPNFDGTTEEPEVLPSAFPNLLVNGAEGIAVGMATKIPPHNLKEILDAAVALIDDPELSTDELLRLVPGPDFPTGGTIYGRAGIREAYETGRGRVVVRGNAAIEELDGGRSAIAIDEIPFQVNKARLIEQIAELVKERRLEGITALRDESDRHGMRIVLELRRDVFPEVVLNHLDKHTALQQTFGVILLAIVDQRPRVLSLRELIGHYVDHRREVVLRRTRFLLDKARARAHILEGFRKALDFIDEVIATIRASATVGEARDALVARFEFTPIQADAILEMRLQRLTGLEREKIEEEYRELLKTISELEDILASEVRLMGVVKQELQAIGERFADPRRTRIIDSRAELTIHDLVAEEDQVVTLSHLGYIKRCSPDEWRQQKRGGSGTRGMATRDEDFVTSLFIANTHAKLLVFTSSGRVYPLEVHEVPEAGRAAKGRPIVNLVPVEQDERIAAVVTVRELTEDSSEDLLFVSRMGLVKRTPLREFRNIRPGGLHAAGVAEGDEVAVVKLMEPDDDVDIMILTARGKSIRFPRGGEKGAPVYGRNAMGNKGIALGDDDHVVDALLIPHEEAELEGEDEDLEVEENLDEVTSEDEVPPTTLLTVTELGFGKRSPFTAWRVQARNGKGVHSHLTNAKTGGVVGALTVSPDDELMIVTDTGRVIRIQAASVRFVKGRQSQGVRLMRLDADERIVDIARYAEAEAEADDALESDDGGSEE